MKALGERLLELIAAVWIFGGMAWYAFAFTREFYKANQHAVTQLFDKFGL